MCLLLTPISYLPHISRGWHPRVATLSNSEQSRNGIPCILRISPLSKYNKPPPRSFLEIGRWDKDDRDFQVCHRGKWVEKQKTHTSDIQINNVSWQCLLGQVILQPTHCDIDSRLFCQASNKTLNKICQNKLLQGKGWFHEYVPSPQSIEKVCKIIRFFLSLSLLPSLPSLSLSHFFLRLFYSCGCCAVNDATSFSNGNWVNLHRHCIRRW